MVASGLLSIFPKAFYRSLEGLFIYPGHLSVFRDKLKVPVSQGKEMLKRNNMKEAAAALQEVHLPPAPGVSSSQNQAFQNRAWFIPPKPGKPTLLISGGNMMDLEDALTFWIPLAKRSDIGFLGYEYPGYGLTAGKPSESSLCHSIEAASAFLETKDIPVTDQILYGISLGSAVSVHLAAKKPVKALILQSAMSSMSDVVKANTPQCLPLHKHVQSPWNSLERISKVRSPLLIVHGEKDPLVPETGARRLLEHASSSMKEIQIISRAKEGIIIRNVNFREPLRWNHADVIKFHKSCLEHNICSSCSQFVVSPFLQNLEQLSPSN